MKCNQCGTSEGAISPLIKISNAGEEAQYTCCRCIDNEGKDKAAKNKALIIKTLSITEEIYVEMVERCGYVWLRTRLSEIADLINEIAKSKLFWEWWKNQWEIRDEQYIRELSLIAIDEQLTGNTRLAAIALYNETHDPYTVKTKLNTWVRKEIIDIIELTAKKQEAQL